MNRCPLLALAAVAALSAQTPPPSFEVVSVKLAPQRTGEDRMVRMSETPARIVYANVSLRMLVCRAWKQSDKTVSGPGDWIDATRYDVSATLPQGASPEQIPAMLQKLLAEHMGVAVHTVTKEQQGFDLVVGRNGATLEKSTEDTPSMPSILKGRIVSPRMPMELFAHMIGYQIGRPVNDKTGMEGLFNIDFTWAPDVDAIETDNQSSRASLYTSLREQLGLELRPAKAEVEYLVIDKASRIPVE